MHASARRFGAVIVAVATIYAFGCLDASPQDAPAPLSSKRQRVLIFGDSISGTGTFGEPPNTAFGHLLDRMRSDLDVTIRYVLGESTRTGERRLRELIGDGKIAADPTATSYLVFLEGINDTSPGNDGCHAPPEDTAERLMMMARFAAERGFVPIVLTLTPAKANFHFKYCPNPRFRLSVWRDGVNNELLRLSKLDAWSGIRVVEFGDHPKLDGWWESNPNVHPKSVELRKKMAKILSDVIPRTD